MASTPRRRAALLAVAVALMVAACSGTSSSPSSTASASATSAGQSSQPASPTATAAAPVTLTYLVDDSQNTKDTTQALADAYHAKHPNVTINIETRPQGSDGDNVVKTRLATGDMDDLFFYNSGSLLVALHPQDTLVDLSKESFISNVDPKFTKVVTAADGSGVYGVPTGTALGGGILYNKKAFEKAGVSVPKTWAEFESNNAKLKAAGIAPVGATFGASSTWTSQLFVLADFYNVSQAVPDFAAKYTTGTDTYSNTPAASNGFKYLQEGHDKGWWQKDYQTTTFEQGLKLLADGTIAQYPMLTFALSTLATNSPDKINDIGFFAQPGTDASKNGLTLWMPAGTYIPKTSKHIDAAKDFLAFIATPEAADVISAKVAPGGPYMIKGAKLPDSVPPAVKDIQAYVSAGNFGPALEFQSPVKGPSLEQICIAVASGQENATKGAADYDKDVQKQRDQLGIK